MSSQQRRCVCVNVEYLPGGRFRSAAFSRLSTNRPHMRCGVLPNHTQHANRCNMIDLFLLLAVLSLLTAFHTSFAYPFSSCYFTLPETPCAASLLLPSLSFRLGPDNPMVPLPLLLHSLLLVFLFVHRTSFPVCTCCCHRPLHSDFEKLPPRRGHHCLHLFTNFQCPDLSLV